MRNPKVSVIVPIYKVEKYLTQCIESILNQTLKDIEVILVSDGPEKEHRICDEYAAKDCRIKVIKNVNKGLGGARNAGLDVAQGEYIAFVDSDDWLALDTYEKALACFKDDIDYVVFGVEVTGERTSKYRGICSCVGLKYFGKQELDDEKILETNVAAWNKLYRKSIIDKYNLRFPVNMQYEDFPFYFQYCFVSKRAYFLDEPFYKYFQHSDSGMTKTYAKDFNSVKDHILGCKFLYDELNKKGIYEPNKDLFSEIYARWVKIGLSYCKKKDKDKYLNFAFQISNEMLLSDNVTLKHLKSKNFKYIKKDIKTEQKIYLFGLIPVLSIKYFVNDKIKVYLLGIVILKIK